MGALQEDVRQVAENSDVLPALVNQSVALLKDTSLAAFLGAEEMTQRARLEVAATYETFAVYGMLACVYFILTISLSQLARVLERRQDRASGLAP